MPTSRKKPIRAATARERFSGASPQPPPVPLYPYQERWMQDESRFKIAVKATQIGYSFAAALEAVLDCLAHRTLWIVLSRGERQSLEFMRKAREHAQALVVIGGGLEIGIETSFFEKTAILQHGIRFPNGSRIIGLPANPDTARGYTGNMILDEFAFHQHDREIWAAAFGRISRGDLKLRVISTPNGQRGKYYELAKEVGLTQVGTGLPACTERSGSTLLTALNERRMGLPACTTTGEDACRHLPGRNAGAATPWSGHWCDVHTAVRLGCPIDLAALRQAMGDEETWQQEYECVFLSDRENYISMDLIVECQHAAASVALPPDWPAGSADRASPERSRGECYFGYDVARVRDLAVVALVEKLGDVFWTRALIEMPGMKFSTQEQTLGDLIPFCRRGAVDATGLGTEIAERLAAKYPGQVEPVSFTAVRKQEMAVRMKRHFEERTLRIPDHRPLRRDLNAVKRIITSAGNVRFDAERTEQGHADRFWALALALHAAEHGSRVAAASGALENDQDWYAPIRAATVRERGIRDSRFGTRDAEFGASETGMGAHRFSESRLPNLESRLGGFAWA